MAKKELGSSREGDGAERKARRLGLDAAVDARRKVTEAARAAAADPKVGGRKLPRRRPDGSGGSGQRRRKQRRLRLRATAWGVELAWVAVAALMVAAAPSG